MIEIEFSAVVQDFLKREGVPSETPDALNKGVIVGGLIDGTDDANKILRCYGLPTSASIWKPGMLAHLFRDDEIYLQAELDLLASRKLPISRDLKVFILNPAYEAERGDFLKERNYETQAAFFHNFYWNPENDHGTGICVQSPLAKDKKNVIASMIHASVKTAINVTSCMRELPTEFMAMYPFQHVATEPLVSTQEIPPKQLDLVVRHTWAPAQHLLHRF